jgi:putative hydrolase of the HAD superfamily
MPIRAVGFDLDGTLYPAAALYQKLIGKGLPNLRFLIAFGRVRRELRAMLTSQEYRARGIRGIEELHRYQAELVAKRLGSDPERTYHDIETFFYTNAVAPFSKIEPYPGVAGLLDQLHASGLRTGALSDFPCDKKLELLGLANKFDVTMTSEETGFVKPDRASFDLLAQRLGVANDELLYVGNSEPYDVKGSLGAGMRAALISKNLSVRTSAEFTFFSFAKLGDYILSCDEH